jgi:hypothetical protein
LVFRGRDDSGLAHRHADGVLRTKIGGEGGDDQVRGSQVRGYRNIVHVAHPEQRADIRIMRLGR